MSTLPLTYAEAAAGQLHTRHAPDATQDDAARENEVIMEAPDPLQAKSNTPCPMSTDHSSHERLKLLANFDTDKVFPETRNAEKETSKTNQQKNWLDESEEMNQDLVRGGFQPRLPTSLPPPGQQQQPSPLPRRQPVPLMPPAQLHTGGPRVVAPAPAVPLQSPPPSELMDVDPSAGPPSHAVAVQPVLQPLSLGTPKESDTAAPCPAPTQQLSTQRQETLPLFVGPDAPSRPVPEAAPVVTGVHPDLGFQSVFPEAPRSQCWGEFFDQLEIQHGTLRLVLEHP
ncbi:uncharacterized protein LOC126235506 [Schistocerca nitens]|uniref:uncharacterized protein LOC126235506 n=1 Tax=Schistocerca nitens TaxID=7011 RepID=UPI00211753E9|nr:uncharacterized protein LOC126235506 [Schistocerca nitens]